MWCFKNLLEIHAMKYIFFVFVLVYAVIGSFRAYHYNGYLAQLTNSNRLGKLIVHDLNNWWIWQTKAVATFFYEGKTCILDKIVL